MATNFPTTIDTPTNPIATDTEVAVPHASQHTNANDAIVALETKVGVNGSAVPTTHDYKLSGVTGSDKAASKTGTETLTNKTLTNPVINVGSDATGDMYYRNSSGILTRLPIGTAGQILTSNGTIPAFTSSTTIAEVYAVDTGAVNAIVVTPSPVLTSYAAGQPIKVKVAVTNTGAVTINANGLGAKTIKKGNGTTDLVAEDIMSGQVISLEYDGTNFQMISPTADVVAGVKQTFFGDGSDGDVTINSNTTLTRDMFYNNLTINNTFTLNTANYKVFVAGALTNNGTIANNGVNGGNGAASVNGIGGAAVATGTFLKAGDGGLGTANVSGGPGGGGSGAGIVYIAANTIAVEGTINAIGGNGGNGTGTGGPNIAGGAGGNVNTVITTGSGGNGGSGGGTLGGGGTITSSKLNVKNPINLNLMFDPVTVLALTGGAGGGGGGSSAGALGGGGGGMGGVIVEIYKTLTTSGTKSVAGGTAGSSTGGSAAVAGSAGRIVTIQLV